MLAGRAELWELDGLIENLLALDLLPLAELTRGEVTVEALPRRNQNFRVACPGGGGLFVKQPDPTVRTGAATLRTEGALYLGTQDAVGQQLGLPRVRYWDAERPLLVVDLLEDHVTLSDLVRQRVHPQFPLHVWRMVGTRLGQVHQTLSRMPAPEPTHWTSGLPWVVHAPLPWLEELGQVSPAGQTVLGIVQGSSAMVEGLRSVSERWQARQRIHGDIRAANVLVPARAEVSDADVRLIDWELSRLGDPGWDLAGLLAALLLDPGGPLGSVGREPIGSADEASLPWGIFQAATRAAWSGYRAGAGPDGEPASRPERAALYVAAKLVEGCIEATAETETVTADLIGALQIAENVFADPITAARDFFALQD